MKDAERHQDPNVYIQVLGIAEVATLQVQDRDRKELDQAVQLDELEGLKGCGQCSSAFSEQSNDARDVLDLRGERSSDRRLSFRQRNA